MVEAITVDNPWRELYLASKFPSIFYCWKTGVQREIFDKRRRNILGAQKYMVSTKAAVSYARRKTQPAFVPTQGSLRFCAPAPNCLATISVRPTPRGASAAALPGPTRPLTKFAYC